MLCSNFWCAEIECRGRDYMMNYIWLAMLVFSLFAAAAKGNMGALSSALISGGTDAVSLALKLVGIICFWNGLMAVAEKSGLTRFLCRLLSPVLKLLFPTLKDEKAKNAIAMNMTANFLGLGNAATPFGLEAVSRLKTLECKGASASDNMVRFVVINSAALHLVPTTVALLRTEYNSASPMETLVPGLLTSLAALFVGVSLTALLKRFFKEV